MKSNILGNALILVILTTVAGGYFIHWMIAEITLSAAFVLAAILSPTDPVAVNGIAKRIHIPEKILVLVRGESLINDATGLVAFNYAVAAVITGSFTLYSAVLNFIYVFVVGAICGFILGFIVPLIRMNLHKKGIDDVAFHSLIQLLTPFIIFIIAEEVFHASGAIAVVVAGIIYSAISEKTGTITAEEQVLTENIWSIILFVLNGIVFLLLGLNIPPSMYQTINDPNIGNMLVIGYVIIIGIVILGIRFIWSYAFNYYQYSFKKIEKPTIKNTLIISLTGVRGTVTIAGVLSISFIADGGRRFPQISLILFLTAGVILSILLMATVFLPIVSKGEAENTNIINQYVLNKSKAKLLLAAMEKLRLETNEENQFGAHELMREYKRQFSRYSIKSGNNSYLQKMKEVRLIALKAEKDIFMKLVIMMKC